MRSDNIEKCFPASGTNPCAHEENVGHCRSHFIVPVGVFFRKPEKEARVRIVYGRDTHARQRNLQAASAHFDKRKKCFTRKGQQFETGGKRRSVPYLDFRRGGSSRDSGSHCQKPAVFPGLNQCECFGFHRRLDGSQAEEER